MTFLILTLIFKFLVKTRFFFIPSNVHNILAKKYIHINYTKCIIRLTQWISLKQRTMCVMNINKQIILKTSTNMISDQITQQYHNEILCYNILYCFSSIKKPKLSTCISKTYINHGLFFIMWVKPVDRGSGTFSFLDSQ